MVAARYHDDMAMTLRLEPQDDAALTELARAQGVSKNEAALRAIRRQHEQARAEQAFDDALADTLARYPETIRRLGE